MSPELGLAELLDRIAARYASINGYRDSGDLETVFIQGPASWQRRTTFRRFRTEFLRPASFRFEVEDVDVGPAHEWTRWVVWQPDTESQAKSWGTLRPEIDGPNPLDDALGALAGVSGRSSVQVASLLGLIPSDFETMRNAEAWRIAGHQSLDGSDCFLVQEVEPGGERFWFDSDTLLLRRIESRHEFNELSRKQHAERIRAELDRMGADDPNRQLFENILHEDGQDKQEDFITESVATWRPILDVELHKSAFSFEPPAR